MANKADHPNKRKLVAAIRLIQAEGRVGLGKVRTTIRAELMFHGFLVHGQSGWEISEKGIKFVGESK